MLLEFPQTFPWRPDPCLYLDGIVSQAIFVDTLSQTNPREIVPRPPPHPPTPGQLMYLIISFLNVAAGCSLLYAQHVVWAFFRRAHSLKKLVNLTLLVPLFS